MNNDTKLVSKLVGPTIATCSSITAQFIRELVGNENSIDDVGCNLELLAADVNEALRWFNKFHASRVEAFSDFKVKLGDYAVEWEYIGEGNSGDYDWKQVDDYPHLRANLSWKGKPCIDGSYCTNASTSTPRKELRDASRELVGAIIKSGGIDTGSEKLSSLSEVPFNDKIMQEWTWRKYTR